jgi:hypothetical protein
LYDKDQVRFVVRNIDDIGLRGNNAERAVLGEHLLLWCVDEGAGGASGNAEALDGLKRIRGLVGKRFPDLFGPSQIGVHPNHEFRVVAEGFYALVQRGVFQIGDIVRRIAEVAGSEDDIRGGSAGRED